MLTRIRGSSKEGRSNKLMSRLSIIVSKKKKKLMSISEIVYLFFFLSSFLKNNKDKKVVTLRSIHRRLVALSFDDD